MKDLAKMIERLRWIIEAAKQRKMPKYMILRHLDCLAEDLE